MHRILAALSVYCLLSGASFAALLQLCARCSSDNAYLGEVFLLLILVLLGVILGLTWLITARREALRGLAAGGLSGLAVGSLVVAIGTTRTLVPPALSLIELVLIAAGFASTVLLARVDR